jgi:hypothetical protein
LHMHAWAHTLLLPSGAASVMQGPHISQAIRAKGCLQRHTGLGEAGCSE